MWNLFDESQKELSDAMKQKIRAEYEALGGSPDTPLKSNYFLNIMILIAGLAFLTSLVMNWTSYLRLSLQPILTFWYWRWGCLFTKNLPLIVEMTILNCWNVVDSKRHFFEGGMVKDQSTLLTRQQPPSRDPSLS